MFKLWFIVDWLVESVAEKNFLESETGLKVLQSGVGEVSAFTHLSTFILKSVL